jgi:hypothetical protein
VNEYEKPDQTSVHAIEQVTAHGELHPWQRARTFEGISEGPLYPELNIETVLDERRRK